MELVTHTHVHIHMHTYTSMHMCHDDTRYDPYNMSQVHTHTLYMYRMSTHTHAMTHTHVMTHKRTHTV